MAPGKKTKRTVITRKTAPKTKKSSKKQPTDKVKNELISILEELNKEEISWLITQAKTMVYNHKVEEVNKAARNLANSKNKKTHDTAVTVDIVQTGGTKNFNIIIGNARLFLNLEELKSLVKIASAAENPRNGSERIYRWCNRERKDILIDGGITGPADRKLKVIYGILKERFTVG